MIAEGRKRREREARKHIKGPRERERERERIEEGDSKWWEMRDAIDLQSCPVVHASVYTNHMHINDHSLVLVRMAEQNVVIQITWLASR